MRVTFTLLQFLRHKHYDLPFNRWASLFLSIASGGDVDSSGIAMMIMMVMEGEGVGGYDTSDEAGNGSRTSDDSSDVDVTDSDGDSGGERPG